MLEWDRSPQPLRDKISELQLPVSRLGGHPRRTRATLSLEVCKLSQINVHQQVPKAILARYRWIHNFQNPAQNEMWDPLLKSYRFQGSNSTA